MLQIEVEAQPVPQDATMSHRKTTRRKRGETSAAARRDGAQQGDCQGSSQRVRPTLRERSTDRNLGAPSPPQYRPSRIRKEKHEGKVLGKERQGEDGRVEKPATCTCCGDLDWPSDS